MSHLALDRTVRIAESGEVTTCAALLDQGRAIVQQVERYGRTERTAYFCYMIGDFGPGVFSGWEISPAAYHTRAARGQDRPPIAPLAQPKLPAAALLHVLLPLAPLPEPDEPGMIDGWQYIHDDRNTARSRLSVLLDYIDYPTFAILGDEGMHAWAEATRLLSTWTTARQDA